VGNVQKRLSNAETSLHIMAGQRRVSHSTIPKPVKRPWLQATGFVKELQYYAGGALAGTIGTAEETKERDSLQRAEV